MQAAGTAPHSFAADHLGNPDHTPESMDEVLWASMAIFTGESPSRL
jgi:hypothetical protein